jgi:voltage-gated potassium channel Kch
MYSYFIMITISTVGYGDISPSTTLGRSVVLVVIFTALMVIPHLLSSTIDTYSTQKGTSLTMIMFESTIEPS